MTAIDVWSGVGKFHFAFCAFDGNDAEQFFCNELLQDNSCQFHFQKAGQSAKAPFMIPWPQFFLEPIKLFSCFHLEMSKLFHKHDFAAQFVGNKACTLLV